MATCRFQVTKIALERNVRGQDMRRVVLQAIASEPFQSQEPLPDGVDPPGPDGSIALLVSPAYAKSIGLGDEFALERR